MRPDFVVAGAMKAGTTWVDAALRQATDARLPSAAKELFFFDRHWDRGPRWYERQFPTSGAGPVGEVASTYFASVTACERLATFAPEAAVVIVLRNPVDRSWSHFRHLIRKGEVHPTTPLEQAVRERPEIVEWSRYDRLDATWQNAFGQRLTLLRHDDLRDDPAGFLVTLAGAIGASIDPEAPPVATMNESRQPRSAIAARIAGRTSSLLHGAGAHGVVELAKRLGASRLLERPEDETIERAADSGRVWLREQLAGAADRVCDEQGWSAASW